jgi:hypothetical protein
MDKKNKIILTSGISVASVSLLAVIISAFYTPKAPDPKQLGPTTKVKYMATKEFARLPESEKEKYVAKVGWPRGDTYRNLSNEERQTVFKNTRKVRHKQMRERVNKFFKMSKEEQNKVLDDMIAQWDKRRKEMEARRAANGNTGSSNRNRGGGPPRGNRQAMMQGIFENTDSTTRAQMAEFFKRLRERRQQTQKK